MMSRHWAVRALVILIWLGALVIGGCVRREHLHPDYGVAYRAWFEAQQRATENGPVEGLDSEEAAAIYGAYKDLLGGRARGRARTESPVLLIPERARERGR